MKLEELWGKQEFDPVYRMMERSFPKCETRTYEKARGLLDDPGYHIYAVRQETGAVCAFLSVWDFDRFRFVEHFAVSEALRGGGLGSRMMAEFLRGSRLPVYLEVEDGETGNAGRRVRFYRALGFALTEYGYMQPNLQPAGEEVRLRIMSYPAALSYQEFLTMRELLHTRVYAKN